MKTQRRKQQERRDRVTVAEQLNDAGDRPVVFCTCVTGRGAKYCKIHAGGKHHG